MPSTRFSFFRPLLPTLVLATLLTCAANTPDAVAQWQPTKDVQFIIMAGKGGGADKAVRRMVKIIANSKLAAVPFKPINITGGSGANAMLHLKKRAGDNHLILFTLNSFYTTPLRRPELKLDISQFAPIGRMAEDTFILWVHSSRSDLRSFDDFIKAARAAGSKWIMAGTGSGSEDNLLTDFLNATYGLKMTYKPFKGGGRVAKELVAQACDSTVNNPSEQLKYFNAGTTKPLAAFTPSRLKKFLRIPTLRETGMEFHYYMQRSVVGAPGMSAAAQQYYQRLFKNVFDSKEWQAYRTKNSLGGDFISGPKLHSYWLRQRQKHARWLMAIPLMGAAAFN
jgi:tripartite-type tricarboxylate transporter receptor subunit TctC